MQRQMIRRRTTTLPARAEGVDPKVSEHKRKPTFLYLMTLRPSDLQSRVLSTSYSTRSSTERYFRSTRHRTINMLTRVSVGERITKGLTFLTVKET